MATGWIDPRSQFDYDTENTKIAKQRKLAEALAASSMNPGTGQFIKGGDFTGYAGPGIAGMLRQLGEAWIGKQADDEADALAKDLPTRAQDALAYQLENKPWMKRDPMSNPEVDSRAIPAMPVPGQPPAAPPQLATKLVPQDDPQMMPVSTQPPLPPVAAPPVPDQSDAESSRLLRQGAVAAMTPEKALLQAKTEASSTPELAGLNVGAYNTWIQNRANAIMQQSQEAPAVQPKLPAPLATKLDPASAQNAPASVPQPVPQPVAPGPVPSAAMGSMQPAVAPAAMPQAPQQQSPQSTAARIETVSSDPTQAENIQYLARIARTGPEGKLIAEQAFRSMFSDKNNDFEYKTVKQGDNEVLVAINKRNPNINKVIYKGDSNGQPSVAQQRVDIDKKELEMKTEEARAKDMSGINSQKDRLAKMQELVPLIQKVGTGRMQTPWNNLTAYITDSTDLDKMNRAFNEEQLTGAIEWLKGQGSITDAERKILADARFNKSGSTQSNVDLANQIIGLLQKHIPLAESNYQKKYGGGSNAPASNAQPAASTGSGTKTGHMYSWQ